MKTLLKITFNKNWNEFRLLVAAADRNGNKIQKFGFDAMYPFYSKTKEGLIHIINNRYSEFENPVKINF